MRPALKLAVLLYPAAWRARYGAEMAALLEDAGAEWPDFVDLCKGAIEMQILKGRAWRFVCVCAVAGLIAAGIVAWLTPTQYRSQAVLRMSVGPVEDRVHDLNLAEQEILNRSSLATLIQTYNLYPEERTRLPLEDIIAEMRNKSIQIRLLNADAFSLAFNYASPQKAQAVVTKLSEQFLTGMRDSAPLELLDPASLPESGFEPNRFAMLMLGLGLGIAAGIVLLGIRRWPMVAAAGASTAVLVVGVSFLVPNMYRSQAVFRSKSADAVQAAKDAVSDRAFLQSLILSPQLDLYREERRSTPVDRIVEMQQRLTLRQLMLPNGSSSRALSLAFDYQDRYKAQAVMQQLTGRIMAIPGMEVLDPPSMPAEAFYPNRMVFAMLALFAGLLLGTIASAVHRRNTPALAT